MQNHNLSAIYCPELSELILETGTSIKVPAVIARTVDAEQRDTRFIRSWAVMQRLIPASASIGLFEVA